MEFQYLSITYEHSNNKNNKPFLFVPSLYNIYNKFITQLQPGFYPVSKALYHATINHQFYLFIVMTAVNLRTKTFFHGLSSYQHNISSVTLILACRSNSQRKLLTNCSGEPLYIKAPTYMAMRLGEQYKRNLIIHPSTSVKVIFFCFILPST